MIAPTVHLNGSSGSVLVEGFESASQAIHRALVALIDASPNARDYYPQGDAAFRTACAEHNARVAKLQSVLDDLRGLHENVQTQLDERSR